MAIRGGKSAKVTRMNKTEAKVQPIPRDRDNTDDLQDALTTVHSRYSKIQAPEGTKRRKGSFDPTNNTAFNGNTVVTRST